MPEVENARFVDGFRLPLSSIRDAHVVVVLGDEPVAERAPIVDLWMRAARRNGAEILYELDEEKVRAAERAILIWSGADGEARLAAHAQRLGVWGAFFLPRAPNARGVCEAWAAAADEEEPEAPDPIRLLVVSGDEALANPDVRALAEQAEHVLVLAMFERPARPLADLVLPGNELPRARRDLRQPRGTPAAPAARRDAAGARRARLDLEARRALRRRALAVHVRGLRGAVGPNLRRAAVRRDRRAGAAAARGPRLGKRRPAPRLRAPKLKGLRLVAYRPLFSGPGGRARPELQFQRPEPVLEIAFEDARSRGIENDAEVEVRSNGTSARLRARVSRTLATGTVRAADEHVRGLLHDVEVTRG